MKDNDTQKPVHSTTTVSELVEPLFRIVNATRKQIVREIKTLQEILHMYQIEKVESNICLLTDETVSIIQGSKEMTTIINSKFVRIRTHSPGHRNHSRGTGPTGRNQAS